MPWAQLELACSTCASFVSFSRCSVLLGETDMSEASGRVELHCSHQRAFMKGCFRLVASQLMPSSGRASIEATIGLASNEIP